jgi:hypothetical protein
VLLPELLLLVRRVRGGAVFSALTDEFLDLTAAERGFGRALYAQLEIELCCCFCCTCSCD